ncbi:hypothetical protein DFH09DRAFT_1081101 [Mycena vulgaris]|nr:hypothetical protein DFH09DRAFT_1081101 [Mycena vulgaris]
MDRPTGEVWLEWYPRNIYAQLDKPKQSSFSRSTLECMSAYGAVTATKFYNKATCSQIQWPTRLLDDTKGNHSYNNPDISQALMDVQGAVVNICLGKLHHPAWSEYHSWMQMKRDYSLMELHINFSMCNAITAAKAGTSDELSLKSSEIQEEERRTLIDIPVLLFKLVVLPVYLGQLLKDDFQLYYLAHRFELEELASIGADDPFAAAKCGYIALLVAEGVRDTWTVPRKSLKDCNIHTKTLKSSGTIPNDYLLASPFSTDNSAEIFKECPASGLARLTVKQGTVDPGPLPMKIDLKHSQDVGPFRNSEDKVDDDPDADMEDDQVQEVPEPVQKREEMGGEDE